MHRLVENAYLKHWRGIATCCAKIAASFLAVLHSSFAISISWRHHLGYFLLEFALPIVLLSSIEAMLLCLFYPYFPVSAYCCNLSSFFIWAISFLFNWFMPISVISYVLDNPIYNVSIFIYFVLFSLEITICIPSS